MNSNFETIEKYVDGELEGDELKYMFDLLSTDPEMIRDYNLSLEINNSILEDDVITLRDTIQLIQHEEPIIEEKRSIFNRPKFYYYAAASTALLIAAGSLMQERNVSDFDNEVVFEKYYTPYEVSVTYRSGDTEVDRILLSALERYEEKDYEQALVLFEKVLISREDDMATKLYSGITYMEEEKYQKAKTTFNSIITNNNNLFIEQSKWYLALCYLKTNKIEDAQVILKEMIKEESYYKETAIEILKDIEN